MKRRMIAFLLAAIMVVSLLPTMAFADDGFAITNGTPESDKETNHGYIAIDKTSAAEGETVTITVTPDEGYELKADSLKVYETNTVVKSEPQALPITPMQDTQDKTKYTFTMPAYAVVVVAEFEEVGGTPSGKTLPYSFDFETDMVAEGWTNIDADNDGQDWITGTTAYAGNGFGNNGSECAISQSFDNNIGPFNADNWLFSPAITIPAGGAIVSWYEQSQDPDYPDFYEVYICETNTSTDTSKMTEIFSGTAANPWNQRSVELEAAEYAGKTVYIAFRHLCYDYYFLEIDDFAVEAVAPAMYTIVAGANSEWTKGGTAGLLITSDAPFAKFSSVKIDGSTIAASNYIAEEGSTKITLAPAYLETLSVGTHSIEIVSDDGSASTNFTIKATVPPDPCEGYTDINRNGWYHSAADFVISRGLMGSTKTDALTFEPNTKVSRAMVASILYRICGSPEVEYAGKFTDVKEGSWFTTAIEWCAQNGLASGYTDGTFKPNATVSRQELAVFMYKLADYLGKDVSGRAELDGFADGASVPAWSEKFLQWAVDAGLISGKANGGKLYLAPTANATRAEFASIIMRFVQNIAEAG